VHNRTDSDRWYWHDEQTPLQHGSAAPTMLVLLGVLVLLAIVLVPRALLFQDAHVTQLGSMSERWLAEYRASQQM
jgi:hypothetical protein